MDGHAHSIDPARLVEHDDFVRRLARSMLRDQADADDAAQQTLAAALTASLRRVGSLRFWLSSAVRNFSRQIARGDARRRRREEAVARPERVPSVSDVLEHEELRSLVVKAVLRLDEPYRTAVLLRWFDGLSSREIAARLGQPVDTVRTRLKRATAMLRRDLDSRFGSDASALGVALSALARIPAGWAASSKTGTLAVWALMTTTRKVAFLAIGLVAATAATWLIWLSKTPSDPLVVPHGDAPLSQSEDRTRAGLEARRSIRPAPFVESGPASEPGDTGIGTGPAAAARPVQCRLHVVDRESGEELSGVEAWNAFDSEIPVTPQEDPLMTVKRVARSPLVLDPGSDVAHLWVRAEGHSWGWIAVDLQSGGDRFLSLMRAASIAVTLENYDPRSRGDLRVRFPEGTFLTPAIARIRPDQRPTVIEGLPPGPCDLSFEIGPWYAKPVVLGSTSLVLPAGQTTPVTLRLRSCVMSPARVPLRGTVTIPPGWEGAEVKLSIKPLSHEFPEGIWKSSGPFEDFLSFDLTAPVGDEPRPFDAGEVAPGPYLLEVWPFQFQEVVDVPPAGLTALRLEIPPPAELTVRVADAATDEDLLDAGVAWNIAVAGRDFDGVSVPVAVDPKTRRATLRVPIGDVLVRAFLHGYPDGARVVRVHAGRNSAELRLTRLIGFKVRFLEGEAIVPARVENARLRVTTPDGAPVRVGFQDSSPEVQVWVPAPARYRVTAAAPSGYEPIPALDVDVSNASIETVRIPLVRSR